MSNQARGNGWVAGVDGCPAGWMVVFARVSEHEGSTELRLCVQPRFADILCADQAPAVIAVDIPIGLPAQAGRGGRAAEHMVRPLLGERQSSVFSVPSRAALERTDYGEACVVALATSEPPRKISKQLFMIVPKIREVDACLRAEPAAAPRVFEVHPELAFWRLNGARALAEPKKVKGRCHEPGLCAPATPSCRSRTSDSDGAQRTAQRGRCGRSSRCARVCRGCAAHSRRHGAALSRSARARCIRAAHGDVGVTTNEEFRDIRLHHCRRRVGRMHAGEPNRSHVTSKRVSDAVIRIWKLVTRDWRVKRKYPLRQLSG